jgi:hypothetical protein
VLVEVEVGVVVDVVGTVVETVELVELAVVVDVDGVVVDAALDVASVDVVVVDVDPVDAVTVDVPVDAVSVDPDEDPEMTLLVVSSIEVGVAPAKEAPRTRRATSATMIAKIRAQPCARRQFPNRCRFRVQPAIPVPLPVLRADTTREPQ